MWSMIVYMLATDEERQLALKWADLAYRRFDNEAVEKLKLGLRRDTGGRSRKALRLAIWRAEANLKTKNSMAARKDVDSARSVRARATFQWRS